MTRNDPTASRILISRTPGPMVCIASSRPLGTLAVPDRFDDLLRVAPSPGRLVDRQANFHETRQVCDPPSPFLYTIFCIYDQTPSITWSKKSSVSVTGGPWRRSENVGFDAVLCATVPVLSEDGPAIRLKNKNLQNHVSGCGNRGGKIIAPANGYFGLRSAVTVEVLGSMTASMNFRPVSGMVFSWSSGMPSVFIFSLSLAFSPLEK